MNKLTKQQKEEIINRIHEDKPLTDEYRFLIPFETEREYELTYANKQRKEDILADTLSVPFQAIKKFGEIKGDEEWSNMLIFGDNLQSLKHLLKLKKCGKLRNPDGRIGVKLVYIDPPFATEQEFKGSKGEKAYLDKIAGAEFLEFLRKRLIFLKELLTEDGCIYVHLDYRTVHYVKLLMDEVFDKNSLVNEIVYAYRIQGISKSSWPRKHQTILMYAKSDKYYFQPEKERIYYEKPFINTKRDENGRYYSDVFVRDVWDCDYTKPFISGSKEYLNYPTQKREGLLKRIIEASSKKGDIVLDTFVGSGTTLAVAEKLGRKWIGVDCGKLAIYTTQKRMLNLTSEIGTKGKQLKPKPFVLYNAGLYQDSGFIEKMDEVDYRKFVLELFGAEPNDNKVKGVQMHGILNNRPVMVFSQRDFLTHELVDDLHKTIGSGLKDEMYIIAPQSVVRFNEDYRDKGKIRYHILKVPYSIIQKILEKNFIRGLQPLSKTNINQTTDSLGFDFIYPPKVECEYYQSKEETLFDNLVIKIKKFEPVQISKKPVEFEDPMKEALSMVMIDEKYNEKIFDMDHYFFNDEIVKNDFKVVFPKDKAGQKLMIIYLDILGNEKVEVKNINDFKKS